VEVERRAAVGQGRRWHNGVNDSARALGNFLKSVAGLCGGGAGSE
jgi:hypothetical protein